MKKGRVERMVMAALFCCNLCCPICCGFFSYMICLNYEEPLIIFLVSVVHFLLVFPAMIIFIVIVIDGITI